MGISYRPPKGSRRSGSSQKTRRNVPLEFYFRGNSDVRSRIRPLGLICSEEIKIPFDCNPSTRNQFEVFDAGITYLHPRAVLTVLNNGVVQIQFLFGVGDDIVGAKAR